MFDLALGLAGAAGKAKGQEATEKARARFET
jgi:hypothetical protein